MKIFGLEIKKAAEERTESSNGHVILRNGMLLNPDLLFGAFSPYCEQNFLNTYKYIAEVQYPVRFIIDRANKANILLKRFNDDSIVWDNDKINRMLLKVNPYYSFKDLIDYYILMRLVCGNAYIFADTNTAFAKRLWKYCDRYYVLPSPEVYCNVNIGQSFIDGDYIRDYDCMIYGKFYKLAKELVLHIRDSMDFEDITLKGNPRLLSQKYTLANLVAVYVARNVIYTKKGALGAIVSGKSDQDGTVPLTPAEKDKLHEQFQSEYGLTHSKNQYIISESPINFIRFGSSISELQPFEETLQDAIQIAGIFGVNKELIPRKDNSTFSNVRSAEVDCFSNVVIPMVNEFLDTFSQFIGLYEDGLYLYADFSDVEVLVSNKREQEDKDKIISDKCKMEFNMGIITLNDWRTQLGMDKIEDILYNKTLLEMNENEVVKIKSILS